MRSGSLVKLSKTNQGDTVKVVYFDGGFSFQKKLISLGINIGSVLKVISISNNQPVLVGVNEARVALGHGMIEYIMVEPVETSFSERNHFSRRLFKRFWKGKHR